MTSLELINKTEFRYLWITISIISTAIYLVWSSAFLKKNPLISIHLLVGPTHGVAAILIIPFIDRLIITDIDVWRRLVSIAILTWIAKALYNYAYSRITVAKVTIFSALTPIYSVILAPIMGVPLRGNQIIGIAIISFSIILFFVKNILKDPSLKIKQKYLSIPLLCALLSTIPTAVASYILKDVILICGSLYISFFICTFSFFASSFLFILKPVIKKIEGFPAYVTTVIGIGILQAISTLAFAEFLSLDHPAIAQSLQRLSSLIQIILAHIFLRERIDTGWHLFCMCISIIGLFFIVFK